MKKVTNFCNYSFDLLSNGKTTRMETVVPLNRRNEMNENLIVEKILSGEKQLYEILLKRNNQKVYRMVRTYIKDTVEIEDIMQNTY